MKLAQIAVVAAALFGGANAGPTAGRRDGTEVGIDCGGDAPSPCNCWTDQVRTVAPPTLINNNLDRSDTLDVATAGETGLIKIGGSSFLEVVIDLDPAVFTDSSAVNVNGIGPPVRTQAADAGADPPVIGGDYLSAATNGFVDADRYANPHVWYTNAANAVMPNCKFTAIGVATDVDNSNDNQLFINRDGTTSVADQYTNNCVGKVRTHLRSEITSTLDQCGFETSSVDVDGGAFNDGTPIAITPGTGVVGGKYTRYLGRIKIETTRQNGELRGAENVLREQYAFQISILFPETLTVTSSPVSIIGEATHEAALTHQIYDSANNNLNLNMVIGTTYPYAVTSETLSGPTKNGDTELKRTLVLDVSDLTKIPITQRSGYAHLTEDLTTDSDWLTYCDPATESSRKQGLAYDNNKVCDYDGDGVLSLGDFVDAESTDPTVFNAGDPAYTFTGTANPQAGAGYFGVALPGGTALPTQRCTGQNTNPADENDQACLQNTFMRLVPRPGHCDFNLPLTLTVSAVCRDDYNGDGTRTDSLQEDVHNGATSADRSVDKTGVANWPITSTNRLYNEANTILDCDSAEYRENIEAREILNFTLASDNFCPRVIATGALEQPQMRLYESSFGESTWGAHGFADAAEAATAVNTAVASSTCDIDANTHTTSKMCLQVPGYATAESDAAIPAASERKLQDEFVFGTTTYIETQIAVASGVNIKSTQINSLFIGRSEDNTGAPRSGIPANDAAAVDGETAVNAANGLWLKRLVVGGSIVTEAYQAHDGTTDSTHAGSYVEVSDNIVNNALIKTSPAGASSTGFFDTNPAKVNTFAAKFGETFQGISRATVQLNKYTVFLTDSPLFEAPEPIAFYANIDIEYQPANEQGELGTPVAKRTVNAQSALPSGAANRARSMAAPGVTGGQATANAGVRANAASGSAGGASTIAGFSSTTVLAAAAVLGAVVVAAGASFFVVRKRRQAAAKTAKRSSSSTELNDTAQVQV